MQELKFRGLTATGEWIYGDLTHDFPNSTAYYKDYSQRISWFSKANAHSNQPVKNGTVGLSIGFNDKNSKEAYQGDIVKINSDEYYSNNTVTFEELKNVIAVINMWDYGWVASAPDKTWCIPLGDLDGMDVEIIGNIYLNSELLKTEE
jgi:uncharacterized phage protein (TIGR01671 family)